MKLIADSYLSVNVISISTRTFTGLPSLVPGSNCHCSSVFTASRSKPSSVSSDWTISDVTNSAVVADHGLHLDETLDLRLHGFSGVVRFDIVNELWRTDATVLRAVDLGTFLLRAHGTCCDRRTNSGKDDAREDHPRDQ